MNIIFCYFCNILFYLIIILITDNINIHVASTKPMQLKVMECIISKKNICNKSMLEECIALQSTNDKYGVCMPVGTEYCLKNNDCFAAGRSKCVMSAGSDILFTTDIAPDIALKNNTDGELNVGVCGISRNTAEDNDFSVSLCKLWKFLTGTTVRAIFAGLITMLGIQFLTGKISWEVIVVLGISAAGIFGSHMIVSTITGKDFICN